MQKIFFALSTILILFVTLLAPSIANAATSQTVYVSNVPAIQDLTYANGKFIGISPGKIHLSKNGETWQTIAVEGFDGHKIFFDGAKYFVLDKEKIWKSDDVFNWTKVPSDANLSDIAYGNSIYVAVGENGVISSSQDGIKWNSLQIGSESYKSVTYTGKLFVAVSEGGIISTSPDGKKWKEEVSDLSSNLNSIIWNNSILVAVGDDNQVITSDQDAQNWTSRINTEDTKEGFSKIIFAKDYFYAVGKNIIIRSKDAITWQLCNDVPKSNINSIAFDGNRFVASDFTSGALFLSDDGLSWTDISKNDRALLNSIIWTGTKFIAVGKKVATASKINSWEYTFDAPEYATENFKAVVWNPEHKAAVLVGENGSIFKNDTTSEFWEREASPVKTTLTSIVWTGKKYIVGGKNGTILTSKNGSIWDVSNSGVASDINAISQNGDIIVAVGSDGTILTADINATQWSKIDSGIASDITSVEWCNFADDSKFLAVGPETNIYSPDGKKWYSGSFPYGTKIKFTNNTFFILNQKTISTSTKPSSTKEDWTSSSFDNDANFVDIASNGNNMCIITDATRTPMTMHEIPPTLTKNKNEITVNNLTSGNTINLFDNKLNLQSYTLQNNEISHTFTDLLPGSKYFVIVADSNGINGFASSRIQTDISENDKKTSVFFDTTMLSFSSIIKKLNTKTIPITEASNLLSNILDSLTQTIDKIENIDLFSEDINLIYNQMFQVIRQNPDLRDSTSSFQNFINKVTSQGAFNTIASNSLNNIFIQKDSKESLNIKINPEKTAEYLQKLDDAILDAKRVNADLYSIEDGGELPLSMVFNVNTKPSLDKAIQVEIPKSVLNGAIKKQITKVKIVTEFAEFVANINTLVSSADTNTFLIKKFSESKDGGETFDFSIIANNKKVEQFAKDLNIAIPYILKDGEKAENLTVFRIEPNGERINVSGIYDKKAQKMRFKTNHLSVYIMKNNKIKFSDITPKHDWAQESINALASKGVIKGSGHNKVEPDSNVTRAEFITMICNTLKIQPDTSKNKFSDIDENDWFSGFVNAGSQKEIISGYADGSFKPSNEVTREEMATIISNVISKILEKNPEKNSSLASNAYEDFNDIDSYAQKAVATNLKRKIMIGQNGKFHPKTHATRAEAAVVIFNLLNLQFQD